MSDDTIYRQAAIDFLEERLQASGYSNAALVSELNRSIGYLMKLPSAQRTGRWIVVSDCYGNGEATACICECSECKDTIWVYKKSDRKWNYCPNCGARMEVQE